MDMAQTGAGGAIRERGHPARVGNDYIGLGWGSRRRDVRPAVAQPLGAYDSRHVRLAGPASEVLNVIFCHVAQSTSRDGYPPKETGEFR